METLSRTGERTSIRRDRRRLPEKETYRATAGSSWFLRYTAISRETLSTMVSLRGIEEVGGTLWVGNKSLTFTEHGEARWGTVRHDRFLASGKSFVKTAYRGGWNRESVASVPRERATPGIQSFLRVCSWRTPNRLWWNSRVRGGRGRKEGCSREILSRPTKCSQDTTDYLIPAVWTWKAGIDHLEENVIILKQLSRGFHGDYQPTWSSFFIACRVPNLAFSFHRHTLK